MVNTHSGNIVGRILGDRKSKNKRACKNCGEVHTHCPFTDCYSEKESGPLPDSLQDYYKGKYGED